MKKYKSWLGFIGINAFVSAIVSYIVCAQMTSHLPRYLAQVPPEAIQTSEACVNRITKACPDPRPNGDGLYVQCIMTETKDSPSCRSIGEQMIRDKVLPECEKEKAAFCADAPVGDGRLANCLKVNIDKLGKNCHKRITK